jgi:hypothetical protein
MENQNELLQKLDADFAARTQRVQDCQNVDELMKLFDEFGTVVGSHKEYEAGKLKYKIAQLRLMVNTLPFDNVMWNVITRTHGIRAKCMELFYYEKYRI